MKNKSTSVNLLNALLLAAVVGLPTYWVARPLSGQAAQTGRTVTGAVTSPHLSALSGGALATPLRDSENRRVMPQILQTLPLAFAENRGQADARAVFLVQGRDTLVWFTPQGLTLALMQHGGEQLMRANSNARQRYNLKLDFIGANPAALPVGKGVATAQMSYFTGLPPNWRTGIQTYSSIIYPNLWPGIDLVYSGTTNRLKYEFIVKPGADPKQIRLSYRGANAPLTVSPQGQLEIPTPFGVIHDDKPTSSQEGGKPIKTEFALHEGVGDGGQQYGFKLGKYDKRKTLVIDPAILVYSGFIGGGGDDEGHAVAVDSNGYAYVTGVTTSAQTTFPELAGPDVTSNGRSDAFIAKLKTDGSGLVYAGYIGGDGDDAGHGIAVDAAGNAYVTGWTSSTQGSFPVVGALGPTFKGAVDAFVAKINPSGTALSYCGYIGGDDEDEGLGIAVDASGRAYVTGLTASTEATFPKLIGPGLLFKGAVDAFVARVKSDGSGLDYAGYLGGSGDDQARGVAVDASGNAYVAGLTTSTEKSFLMTGALGPVFKGGTDAFIAKINAAGSGVSYSGFIGGSGMDEAYGIALDSAGSAYITGRTSSTEATFPNLVGPKLTFNGGIDAFVAKINPAGSALSYAGYIGGTGDDEGFGIAVDSAGNAYVTGRTTSGEATFPKANAFDLTLNGASDGFLAKVNPSGSALSYAGYLGGNGLEEGFGAAVNGLRQVYVTGRSTSADNSFPPTAGSGLTFGGASDAFVTRVDDSSVVCQALNITPAALPTGTLGVTFNQTLTGSGGTAPYSFTIISGAPPTALALSSSGAFSGAATQAGNFTFTVMVTDATGCTGTKGYTLIISGCPAITVNPASLPASTAFTFYSQNITASGGASPYSFNVSAGTLPAGLTLTAGGLLSGAPTIAGTFNVTLRATDKGACFAERPYTLTITANPGLMFYPLPAPVRALETRSGFSGCANPGNPINAGATTILVVRGDCTGIPANAAAITGNITVVPSGPGFLTLFPGSAPQPQVANSNFGTNEITNNVFTVGLGATGPEAGAFRIFASATTHVIVDVTGYYAPPTVSGLYFHPLPSPVRLLQTFPGQTGCFMNGSQQLQGTNDPNANPALDLAVEGRGAGLPSPCNNLPGDAVMLVGNATTVFPTAPFGSGYLTIYPSDATRPTVASSNYGSGDIINGPFAVKLGTDGKFKVYTFSTTHLVIDILGYYSASANDVNGAGLLFTPLPSPARLLETRPDFPGLPLAGCFRPNVPLNGAQIYTQQGRNICTVPNVARALVGNVTVINPTAGGFLTFWPSDALVQPTVATSNFPFPVLFGYNRHYIVGLGAGDGAFKMYSQFQADLIVDISGYFAP
jgi:hypothetical protein